MNDQTKNGKYIVLGAGGHAKVVIDALLSGGHPPPYGILDADERRWGERVLGVPVLGGDALLPELVDQGVRHFVVGVGSTGDTKVRQMLFQRAQSQGLNPIDVRHPSVICSSTAEIGAGVHLLAGAIVNTSARIGDNVIINTGAIIEHDCFIGDHVHIAPGARLAGGVSVGAGAHVGIGATIKQGVSIGVCSIVGAGSVLVRNIPGHVAVAGVPARVLRSFAA